LSATPPYRELPSVHALLEDPLLAAAIAVRGRWAVLEAARDELGETRDALRRGAACSLERVEIARRVRRRLDERDSRLSLRPVINATGILLHTGLGRAPLALEAIEAVSRVARGYCSLELDLDSGQRGQRSAGVGTLIARLTGAEAAVVVNNNAGATVLALRALCAGKEVIVSRGQLIEIGGSFRLPEIFEVSGARLREVGTTNKTRLADYERAIGPETAALLRVHPSNFRVVGFTESVPMAQLAPLAQARGLWAIDDLGSGALAPGKPPVGPDEPTVSESLRAGADLVLLSGDKLLGGPQCGILAGRARAISRIASDPLMRALRVDKMTLAALEATLRLARDEPRAADRIPLWGLLTVPLELLQVRAEALAAELRLDPGLKAEVINEASYLGGGSVPGQAIPSVAVRVEPPYPPPVTSAQDYARRLRLGEPAVVGRIQQGAVLVNLRAVATAEDAALLGALRTPFVASGEGPG
jgi:L-seryl-tRNA(Ser) seleniumtransferase